MYIFPKKKKDRQSSKQRYINIKKKINQAVLISSWWYRCGSRIVRWSDGRRSTIKERMYPVKRKAMTVAISNNTSKRSRGEEGEVEGHTPFKSGSHVILIVMSVLGDSKSNDKREFDNNE